MHITKRKKQAIKNIVAALLSLLLLFSALRLIPALLRALKAHGFDGSLTIEREISGEQQRIDIADTQRYLNGLIEAL